MRSSIGWPSASVAVEIEGVVHRPRRMAFGDVERGEIVPVVLDLGPGRDREAEIGEDLGELVHHLADRMDAALARRRRPAGSCRAARSPAARSSAAPSSAALRAASASVTASRSAWMRGPSLCRSSGVMPPSVLSKRGHRALLAERGDPLRLERRQVRRRGDPAEPVALHLVEIAAHQPAPRGERRRMKSPEPCG